MLDDPGVKLEMTCMACPEQYEGTVDGNPAYFRERSSRWRFCIIEPGGNPIGPGMTPDKKVLYYKGGELPGDGFGGGEAMSLILLMVKEFRSLRATKA